MAADPRLATKTIFSKTIFASVIAIGIAGGAQAQAPSTLDLTGRAPGQHVGNVVGGANGATITGGSDDTVILYNQPGAGGGGTGWGRAGRLTTFAGTDGDGGPLWTYGPPTANGGGAGREAWLSGGGDDAQVTYSRPR